MAALKHLASYLDGTPDNGVLLRATEENKTIFEFWNDDVLISDDVAIPDVRADSQITLEAFSDSSWADCKSTHCDFPERIPCGECLQDTSFSGSHFM